MGFGTAKNAPQIPQSGISLMPTNRGAPTGLSVSPESGGYNAIPTSREGASPAGWFAAALLFATAFGYWAVGVGNAHTEATVIRAWAQSTVVRVVARTATQTGGTARSAVLRKNRAAWLSAYKTTAQKTPGASHLAGSPIPRDVQNVFESKLLRSPATAVQALQNLAASRERDAFAPYPTLVSDPKRYDATKWGLLGGAILFAGIGGARFLPRRRPVFAPSPAPVPVAPAPRITSRPVIAVGNATPFPPPPEIPTIAPPVRGIAATIAVAGAASGEVTRLVKRLEELESLSGQLKSERDESRKELTWTQSALDDFKRRVSDATTLATASAAASAGASEQRAAQAEQRVTEAVEHINEALARAVETEHGVSRAQEIAQTAEERAAAAEARAQETAFQLARAMERLADLERLAAVTRIGGVSGPVGASGLPVAPAALPPPDRAAYPNGFDAGAASPLDNALAAAAKPAVRPAIALSPPTPFDMPGDAARPVERFPAPCLTNTKIADIEASLKLARSIRSRTQKPTGDTE